MKKPAYAILATLSVVSTGLSIAALAKHSSREEPQNVAVILGMAGEQYPIYGTGGIRVTGGHHGIFSSNMKSSSIEIDGTGVSAQGFAPSEQGSDFQAAANHAYFVTSTCSCTLPTAANVAGLEIVVLNTNTGTTITYQTTNGEYLRHGEAGTAPMLNSVPGTANRFISDGKGWYLE